MIIDDAAMIAAAIAATPIIAAFAAGAGAAVGFVWGVLERAMGGGYPSSATMWRQPEQPDDLIPSEMAPSPENRRVAHIHGIKVSGSPRFIGVARGALDMLVKEVPEIYRDRIQPYLNEIRQTDESSGIRGREAIFYCNSANGSWRRGALRLAGVICHEACHVWLHRNGVSGRLTDKEEERHCLGFERDVLEVLEGGRGRWTRHVESIIPNPTYQEIPAEKRWW